MKPSELDLLTGWLGRAKSQPTPHVLGKLRMCCERVTHLLRTNPTLPRVYRVRLNQAYQVLKGN